MDLRWKSEERVIEGLAFGFATIHSVRLIGLEAIQNYRGIHSVRINIFKLNVIGGRDLAAGA